MLLPFYFLILINQLINSISIAQFNIFRSYGILFLETLNFYKRCCILNIQKQLHRAIFLITTLFVSSALIISFTINYYNAKKTLEEEIAFSLENNMERIENTINNLEHMIIDIHFLSGKTLAENKIYYTNKEMFQIFSTFINQDSQINFIGIILPDGNVSSYSRTQIDLTLDNELINSDWYDTVSSSKGELLIHKTPDILTSKPSNDETIVFSKLLFDFYTQKPVGILVVNTDTDIFQLNNIIDTKYILDSALSNPITNSIIHTTSNTIEASEIQPSSNLDVGISQTLNYSVESNHRDLVLTLIIDNSEFFLIVRQIFYTASVIFFIILIFSYFFTKKSSQLITRPIINLTNLMKLKPTAKNIYTISHSIFPRNDEVFILYQEFSKMLNSLELASQDKLEFEQSIQKAELNVYKNQIDSHFMYNTLESINSLAEINDIPQISEIIVALSNMFRYTSEGFTNNSTLQNEIDNVEEYLLIQNIRFQKEYSLTLDIQNKALLNSEIPKIILQPIIENSILHGFNNGGLQGDIKLTASILDDSLIIQIKDNGLGISPNELEGLQNKIRNAIQLVRNEAHHIGLINIEARIKTLYGKKYGINIESCIDCGSNIVITLPAIHKANEGFDKFDV